MTDESKRNVLSEEEAIEFIKVSQRNEVTDEKTGVAVIFYNHPDGRVLQYDTVGTNCD